MYLIHGLTRADCHDIIEGLRLLQKAKPDETATGEERQVTDERIDDLCEEINFCDDVEAVVAWTSNDVKTIRPRWSQKRCVKELSSIAGRLQDRLVELGWDVLANLLPTK